MISVCVCVLLFFLQFLVFVMYGYEGIELLLLKRKKPAQKKVFQLRQLMSDQVSSS